QTTAYELGLGIPAEPLFRSADCYQYFCVPDYGTANGRLHFHAVHFMRTLPTGSVDPNFGRRVRNRRQLNSLQNTWPYGYSMPIRSEERRVGGECRARWRPCREKKKKINERIKLRTMRRIQHTHVQLERGNTIRLQTQGE